MLTSYGPANSHTNFAHIKGEVKSTSPALKKKRKKKGEQK